MSEFARYLVVSGVTASRFAGVMRVAFYRAASAEARFRNKRLNHSAVAAMTGLTRAQVRDFAKQEKLAPRTGRDRMENIIEGWTSDPAFTTSGYAPRRLTVGTRNASFNSLVRKYGGDIPARSVLREMIRNGCITLQGQYISLTMKARQTRSQARLHHLCGALSKLLSESPDRSNALYPLRILNAEVTYPATSAKGRVLMQRRSDKSLRALMAELQAAGSAASIESPPGPGQSEWTTRTRVVLISEELDRRRSDQYTDS